MKTLIGLSHNIEGIVGLVVVGAMVWSLRAYIDRRAAARFAPPRKKGKQRGKGKRISLADLGDYKQQTKPESGEAEK